MKNDYLSLLLQYQTRPRLEQPISIFEISGYPHYENVCSNILAFYLDPQREHGLGNLVLGALLKCCGYELGKQNEVVEIRREFSTHGGGRLDLLIVTDNYVVGIENKIFHHLNNDLSDYRKTIDFVSKGKSPVYRLVLSLVPIKIPENSGFNGITYDELWHEVRANFGFYVSANSGKWVAYLTDFMETTESLAGGKMELTSTDEFFIKHEESVSKLIQDRAVFLGKLKGQIEKLKEMISESGKLPTELLKQWVYDRSCLVHDYCLSGHKIAFDLYISPKGWELLLFGRDQWSTQYLNKLESSRLENLATKEGRFILKCWPLQSELTEIMDATCEWMNWIVKADAESQQSVVTPSQAK